MRGRWIVNTAAAPAEGDRAIALDLEQLRRARQAGAPALPLHEAVPAQLEPLEEVVVDVPRWRGHSFVDLLEWLVAAKLAEAGRSTVTWIAAKRGGATGVRRTLTTRGWRFREYKDKGRRRFVGTPPGPGKFPEPQRFDVTLGGSRLSFAADWGVFSEGGIDAGTGLLFDVASAMSPASWAMDVGVGYGALAVGLVAAGIAGRAVGIDVDSVALLLARMNATAAGVPVELELADGPTTFEGAPLVVCNFPTHAKREAADVLVRALARCAATGVVLVVVHASLEERYARWFELAGARVAREARAEHVVLRLTPI